MKFTHQQYAQALYESLHDTNPKDYDRIIENFIQVLKSNGELAEYETILEHYEQYDKEQRGIKDVEMTTAMQTTVSKGLIDDLNKIVGSKIEVKQKIDQNLIGGVVLKVDDTLIDGSLRKKLQNLEDTLKE